MAKKEKKIPVFFRAPKRIVDAVHQEAEFDERPIGNMWERVVKLGLERVRNERQTNAT